MKNEKGMGLIQALITIVFIVAIIVFLGYVIVNKYHEVRVETIKTDMLQVEWKIKDYIDKKIVNKEEKEYLGTKLSEMKEDVVLKSFFESNIIKEEEYDKYYVLKDEDLAKVGLEITNYKGSYFLINYDTYEIMVSRGCKLSKDKVLYKLTDIIKESNVDNKNENKENTNNKVNEENKNN